MNDRIRHPKNAGVLSGITGIVCNLALCFAKFITGSLSGSLSITADAVNNLSDAGSSIVTIVGATLARKPADKEHPFGHGRADSVAALVVAVLILLTGLDLAKSSINRILSPSPTRMIWYFVLILVLSIAVKLFMALFNRHLYKKTGNESLKAVMQDSLNDCLATSAALAALIAGAFTNIPWLDGAAGLFVSLFVLFSGADLLKSFSGSLLGKAPSDELISEIKAILTQSPDIWGFHDLSLHEYGRENCMGSVHAEISSALDAVTIHEIIDAIEGEVLRKTGVNITIHFDPVDPDDRELTHFKELTGRILRDCDPGYRFHELKLDHRADAIILSFDLVIPYTEKKSPEEIIRVIQNRFAGANSHIVTQINVEHEL